MQLNIEEAVQATRRLKTSLANVLVSPMG